MVTLLVLSLIICVAGVAICVLPVLALPLLDVAVGSLIIYGCWKLIKKLRKK